MSNAPETPTPVNEHDATRERVGVIAAWLVDGQLRPECVAAAMQEWQVSRRTAQVYVARAAARIVKATTFEDPHFAMKLSQVQRDRLHQDLQELLRKGEFLPLPHWKMKLQTIQANMKLLDSRDRTAAKLLALEATHGKPEPRRPRAKPVAEARSEEKTLRQDSPAARTSPAPAPKPLPPLPAAEFIKRAQAALLPEAGQVAAGIVIAPSQRKDQGDKDMRPRKQPEAAPAPARIPAL